MIFIKAGAATVGDLPNNNKASGPRNNTCNAILNSNDVLQEEVNNKVSSVSTRRANNKINSIFVQQASLQTRNNRCRKALF
jgi:hypothetical protein